VVDAVDRSETVVLCYIYCSEEFKLHEKLDHPEEKALA